MLDVDQGLQGMLETDQTLQSQLDVTQALSGQQVTGCDLEGEFDIDIEL